MGIYIANDIIPLEVWKHGGGGGGGGGGGEGERRRK